jgi:hypothetical protein
MARVDAERWFFLAMTGLVWLVVAIGFAPSFFLRPFFRSVVAAREPIFYLHGVVFTAWIGLFGAQVGLVASEHRVIHRRLGVLGAALILPMWSLGIYAAIVGARRPGGFTGVPDTPLHFFGVLTAWITAFAVLSGLGIALCRRPQAHKRLMLLAAITLAEAGAARWPLLRNWPELPVFWVTSAMLAPLVVWDLAALRRLHPATLWGGLGFLAYGPLREVLASTSLWRTLGGWAVRLPF